MPRALLIVPDYAYAAKSGGGQRSALLYDALASIFAVDVLAVAEYTRPGALENIYHAKSFRQINIQPASAFAPWKFIRSLSVNLVDRAAAILRTRQRAYQPDETGVVDFSSYDLVAARYLQTAARAGALDNDCTVPVLIDIDDRDDQVLARRLEQPANAVLKAFYRRQYREMVALFPRLVKKASHLWFASGEDACDIDGVSTSVLVNIPFDLPALPLPPAPAANKTVLFVGTAQHRPNYEGILHFARAVWPHIVKREPSARLRIVGRGRWDHCASALSAIPNIDLVGEVDDLQAEYARANVVVSPVYSGGGSKIKVVEAFGYNRPVVAAPHSARGFDSQLSENAILCADKDTDMAKLCADLLGDPDQAQRLASRGREIVMRLHDRSAFTKRVIDDCEAVLATAQRQAAR